MEKPPEIDWTHLPENAAAQSLRASLHNGRPIAAHSNRAEDKVTLEVDLHNIQQFQELGDETRLLMTCQGILSSRVVAFVPWPEDMPETPKQWVEQSVGWNDFMAAFPSNILDIYDAELARGENYVTLHLEGSMDGDTFDDAWIHVYLRCEAIEFAWSDGQTLTLEEFAQLGGDYWAAWAAEGEQRRKALAASTENKG